MVNLNLGAIPAFRLYLFCHAIFQNKKKDTTAIRARGGRRIKYQILSKENRDEKQEMRS